MTTKTLKLSALCAWSLLSLAACNSNSSTPQVKVDAADTGASETASDAKDSGTSDGGETHSDSPGSDSQTADGGTTDGDETLSDTATVGDATTDGDATTAPVDADAATSFDEVGNCYRNPHTHLEIINACTSATKVIVDNSGLPTDAGL